MAESTKTSAVRVEDVLYREAGAQPLLARLYVPAGEGPFPAVVEVHGGAWTSGDRLNNAPIAKELAANGITVMSIDFRMPPQAAYPASVADVNYAVLWLKAHSARCRTSPAMVGLLATSSGGHQALLSALRPDDARYAALRLPNERTHDASVGFIALGWPISDPVARYAMARERGLANLVKSHDAYFGSLDAMHGASPQAIVERRRYSDLPPVLVLQGTSDENVTPDMAERFRAAYAAAGGEIELHTFPGAPHTFTSKDPASADSLRAYRLFTTFIQERAQKRAGASPAAA